MEDNERNMSPDEWRKDKENRWKIKRIPFDSEKDQKKELKIILKSLKKYLKKDQEAPKDWENEAPDLPDEYWVKAVIVYGSWAQGEASQNSDVDIALIKEDKYPKDNIASFITDDAGDETGYYFDYMGQWVNWDNEQDLKDFLEGKDDLIGSDFIIVTPFPEVKEKLLALKPDTKVF